jgi:hypothetical protein
MLALIFNDGSLSNKDIKEEFKTANEAMLAQLQIGSTALIPIFWDIKTADRFVRRNGLFMVISGMINLTHEDVTKLSEEAACSILEHPNKVNKIAQKVVGYKFKLAARQEPVDALLI